MKRNRDLRTLLRTDIHGARSQYTAAGRETGGRADPDPFAEVDTQGLGKVSRSMSADRC